MAEAVAIALAVAVIVLLLHEVLGDAMVAAAPDPLLVYAAAVEGMGNARTLDTILYGLSRVLVSDVEPGRLNAVTYYTYVYEAVYVSEGKTS